jgi:hypothetical protein
MAIANAADAQAQYLANLTYREDRSLSEAGLFVAACRALMLLLPASAGQGGDQTLSFNITAIKAQLDDCQSWIAMNSRGNAQQRVVGRVGPSFRGLYSPGVW